MGGLCCHEQPVYQLQLNKPAATKGRHPRKYKPRAQNIPDEKDQLIHPEEQKPYEYFRQRRVSLGFSDIAVGVVPLKVPSKEKKPLVPQLVATQRPLANTMLGPKRLTYLEFTETKDPSVRRHSWFFGEFHNPIGLCTPSLSTTDFSSYVKDVIESNRQYGMVLDIFVEGFLPRIVPSKTELGQHKEIGYNDHDIHAGDMSFIHSVVFPDCFTIAESCPFRDSARFHYADSRLVHLPLFLMVIYGTDHTAFAKFAPEGSTLREWWDNFIKSPVEWLTQQEDEFRKETRVRKQEAHLSHDPALREGIREYFQSVRRRHLETMATNNMHSESEFRLAVLDYTATWMDEYTMLRFFGEFPATKRSRFEKTFERVSNAMFYAGNRHIKNDVECIMYLARKGLIQVHHQLDFGNLSVGGSQDDAIKCCYFSPQMTQLLVKNPLTIHPPLHTVNQDVPFPDVSNGVLLNMDMLFQLAITRYDERGFPVRTGHLFLLRAIEPKEEKTLEDPEWVAWFDTRIDPLAEQYENVRLESSIEFDETILQQLTQRCAFLITKDPAQVVRRLETLSKTVGHYNVGIESIHTSEWSQRPQIVPSVEVFQATVSKTIVEYRTPVYNTPSSMKTVSKRSYRGERS